MARSSDVLRMADRRRLRLARAAIRARRRAAVRERRARLCALAARVTPLLKGAGILAAVEAAAGRPCSEEGAAERRAFYIMGVASPTQNPGGPNP